MSDKCSVCPNIKGCRSQVVGTLPLHPPLHSAATNDFCLEKCEGGFLCTLSEGHKTDHEAFLNGGVVARWKKATSGNGVTRNTPGVQSGDGGAIPTLPHQEASE